MQSLVVFLALAVAAHASFLPLAQPPYYPAIVLDPHGRPLDTAEVIGARALHLQAKALEHGYLSPLVAPAVVTAPAWGVHSAYASPLLGAGLLGHGHLLKKRSLGAWGSTVVAPASTSYSQSSVDIVHPPVYSKALVPVVASPAWGPYSGIVSPLLANSGLLGHGHLLRGW